MLGTRARLWKTVTALIIAVLLQGCATTDRKVNILYEPGARFTGGFGDLYLVQGVRHPTGEAAALQWVLGRVTKKNGDTVAKVVTEIAPASLVLDALNQELKRAGYNVIITDAMPDQAKALKLQDVSIRINETHAFFKDEANSSVKMIVEPWRRGSAVSILSYQAEYSDTAVSGREQLPSEALQETLHLLMARAVPQIVKTLEQK